MSPCIFRACDKEGQHNAIDDVIAMEAHDLMLQATLCASYYNAYSGCVLMYIYFYCYCNNIASYDVYILPGMLSLHKQERTAM